jgi:DNA-binding NarL/FixJ family response regulator
LNQKEGQSLTLYLPGTGQEALLGLSPREKSKREQDQAWTRPETERRGRTLSFPGNGAASDLYFFRSPGLVRVTTIVQPVIKTPVCVVSFHPLVFPAIRAVLAESEFDLMDYRLSSEPPPRQGRQELPKSSVYVIEAHPRSTLTEAEIERVASINESPRMLLIGEAFEDGNAFSFLRMGVKGLVTFAEADDQLARAVHALVGGGFWVPRALLARFVEATAVSSAGGRRPAPGDIASLTHRERQVLDGILENLSNKEIAARLRISERGVKFHISNLLSKNRVRRRADLVLLFLNSTKSSEDSAGAGEVGSSVEVSGEGSPPRS